MPIRTNKVTAEHLKPGAKLWMSWYALGWEPIPVRIEILEDRGIGNLFSVKINVLTHDAQPKDRIFPGDLGVRGANYDDRCHQLFFTRKECIKHMRAWGDRMPNFLTWKNGKLRSKKSNLRGRNPTKLIIDDWGKV